MMIDWITRLIEDRLQDERRHDPVRLEEEAAKRVRIAEFLESVAAFVAACDVFAFFFVEKKSVGLWAAMIVVLLVVLGLLFEGWMFREISSTLQERVKTSRADLRKMFEGTSVYLSRQRVMALRQRGAGNDVCSALLSVIRQSGQEPLPMSGFDVLRQLDPLLGTARTNEALPQISTALAV